MVRANSPERRGGREFHGEISRRETGRKKYVVGGAYRDAERDGVIQYFSGFQDSGAVRALLG
jgi:hypothetical protein